MSEPFMTIGIFQLENLWSQRVPYVFFDLSGVKERADLPEFFANRLVLSESDVIAHLSHQQIDPQTPLILICEDSRQSKRIAEKLAKAKKFANVFVIEGGYQEALRGF